MALAGLLSALRMQGKETVALRDQKVLCVGAGSAGLGVCDAIVQGMVHEGAETRGTLLMLSIPTTCVTQPPHFFFFFCAPRGWVHTIHRASLRGESC